jgi:putative endopeptidase
MTITKKNNKYNKSKKNKSNKTNKSYKKSGNNISRKKIKNLCKDLNPDSFEQFENIFEKKYGKLIKNTKYQNGLIKAFNTPYAPSSIKPQDDYYTYINYSWLTAETKKQKKTKTYYTQIDSFRVVQEKVYYEVIDLVKDYIKKNHNSRSNNVKNVYNALLKLDEKCAENHINIFVEKVKNLIKEGDMIKLLADLNQNEVISWAAPIAWSSKADLKHAHIYKDYISPPVLSIYDYTIYIEDNTDDQNTKKYKKLFKKNYFKFVNKLFKTCVGTNEYSAQDVWDVEYSLLTAMGCNEVKNESKEYYNIVTKKEALEKYGFNWEQFSKLLGYKKCPESFICSSLSYLKCVMDLLNENNNWKSKKWEAYYIYIGVRQIIRFHKKWRYIYYNFWGKFVMGQPVPMPSEIYPIFGLSLSFNTLLTNLYVDKYKNDRYIEYVNKMGQDLLTVFKRIIGRNKWLSPSTKKYALQKLHFLKLIVGSPKLLREDPLLDYSDKDAWENVYKITNWRKMKQINLEGKQTIDIPTIDWFQFKLTGTQAYVVNAYYTPTENAIYVPLGYLQKPFIDLDERGIEYNLAHIGYTLGHEMSHCLDDSGSKYDYKGNLKNWWTPHDRAIFNKKVKDVIKQYETFAAYDGIKMDASIGTGEDIADISGLAICEEYLRDFQVKNDDITPIRALSFEAFFEYIAIQDRQKIYDQAVKAQLKTNPHPMNKYRTNCPLSRLKLFQSLYNIKKGDKMYWFPTDTIWN